MIPFESDSRIFCAATGIPWTEEYARGYAANMLLMRRAMGRARRRRMWSQTEEPDESETWIDILNEEEAPEIDEDEDAL